MGSETDLDDELLVRFVGGDPDAFVEFYRRHTSAMLAYFLRRTGDVELTADLTAEVFAAALIAARRYRPGGSPALAWLYGIAAKKLADSRRRGRVEADARRRLALDPIAIEDEDLERIPSAAGFVDVAAAVASLPEDQRAAVLARIVDERSYADIAAEVACSEMVVRKRVSRGLRILRERLEESQ
ncbi:MAG: RNA polymerase sigma factor [Solirubrobacteraceae bacterium]